MHCAGIVSAQIDRRLTMPNTPPCWSIWTGREVRYPLLLKLANAVALGLANVELTQPSRGPFRSGGWHPNWGCLVNGQYVEELRPSQSDAKPLVRTLASTYVGSKSTHVRLHRTIPSIVQNLKLNRLKVNFYDVVMIQLSSHAASYSARSDWRGGHLMLDASIRNFLNSNLYLSPPCDMAAGLVTGAFCRRQNTP